MMSSEVSPVREKILWGVLIFILVGIAGVSTWTWLQGKLQAGAPIRPPAQSSEPEGSVLATFGVVPDFALTERSGRKFSKAELIGSPWIADFIFTSCPGQCPLMSAEMSRLQKVFSRETGLRFASFSVDPDRDTPEVLSQYADRYGAEKDRWFFLTGPREEMNRILRGFYMNPVEEPAFHSIRFVLVDSAGEIRGYYDASDPTAIKQLAHDTKTLLQGK